MIPAEFAYFAPTTLDEALATLARDGDDASVLAGGHSLLPLMKLRLAAPSMVVDLGRVPSLRGISQSAGHIEIGAMERYVDLEASELAHSHAPMLAQAASLVGDAQVRNRGTIGGALAHADPAGDMPAVVTALDAVIDVASPTGMRAIPAAEFFLGIFQTALEPGEIITRIRVPVAENPRQHYEKFRRRLCDWAIVGVAAAIRIDDEGVVRQARVILTNVGPTPMRATETEAALVGRMPSDENLEAAATEAASGLDPTPELNAPADYKKHLARVITLRALRHAAGR